MVSPLFISRLLILHGPAEETKPISLFLHFDFVSQYPTDDTLLPKLGPFRHDDPFTHLLKSV